MTADLALRAIEALLAVSVAVQTLEHLATRRALSPDGVWCWSVVRDEFAPLPGVLRRVLDLLLDWPAVLGLLGLRLGAALALGAWGGAVPAALVFASTALVCLRFRGLYNGGSDYMTVHVGLALTVARLFPEHTFRVDAALGWIALQTLLSYGMAGLAKVRAPAWRSGDALAAFLSSPRYAVPLAVRRLAASKPVMRIASLGVIGFELSAALVLFAPDTAVVTWLGIAATFHLVNAWVFGLNRFFFAWLAAYPSVVYWATRV